MKKTVTLFLAAVIATALLSGCSAPKITDGAIVSADEVRYLNARPYSDGLAAVKTENGWGFVDENGDFAIEPAFEAVGSFSEGLCAAITEAGEQWGYIDKSGKVVVEGQYTAAAEFSDGFALVKRGNYYEYTDKEGNILKVTVPEKTAEDGTKTESQTLTSFSDASSFSEGIARVEIGDMSAYINTDGEIIAEGFLTSNPFSEGLCSVNFTVEKEDLNGFIDKEGKTVIEPKYLDAGNFSEGLAPFKAKISDGTVSSSGVSTGAVYAWGYLNAEGAEVIAASYDNVYGFKNGLSRVSENIAASVYAYSFINSDGKTVTDGTYTFAYDMTGDGLARVAKTEDKQTVWGFIDKNGAEAVGPKYDNAKDFSEGYAPVCIGDKWGIIDKSGKLVVETKFDDIEAASDGHFLVRYGDRYGFLKIV